MRIFIPVFGTRVSPRFDCASRILTVQVQGGDVVKRWVEPAEPVRWWARILSPEEKSVDVILCGGIRRCDYYTLIGAGIDVYAGLMGEAEDVLHAFLEGEVPRQRIGDDLIEAHSRNQRGWRRRRGGPSRMRKKDQQM